MKKLLSIVLVGLMAVSLLGCGERKSGTLEGDEAESFIESMSSSVEEIIEDLTFDEDDFIGDDDIPGDGIIEAQEPEIVYWEIKTNTGIPVFVAKVQNPNKVAVDFTVDVGFKKGGETLYTCEGMYYNCLPAGETGFMWLSWDEVPEDTEEISLNYTYVAESVYEPVAVKTLECEKTEDGRHVIFEASGDFTDFVYSMVLYSGEKIVAFDTYTFFPGDELECESEISENYDSWEIFCNAYKLK